jgi:hypothetical protein
MLDSTGYDRLRVVLFVSCFRPRGGSMGSAPPGMGHYSQEVIA